MEASPQSSFPPDHHPSAAIVASTHDLLTQILLRLPIKSLLRFKSVCKAWLSLITKSYFSLLRNPNRTASGLFARRFLCSEGAGYSFIALRHDLVAPPPPPFQKIVQSCNGLLLCFSSLRADGSGSDYFIYNPTTEHSTALPTPRNPDPYSSGFFGVGLAFDPSKSPHCKVAFVRSSGSDRQSYQIGVYSSETRSSTSLCVSSQTLIKYSNPYYKVVYWNGSLHWFGSLEFSFYYNLDKERLEQMPMPRIGEANGATRRFPYFVESGDHLHYVRTAWLITVYEMERDYSNWFVRYRVDPERLTVAFPEMIQRQFNFTPGQRPYFAFEVFSLFRRGNDSFLVLHIPGKLLRYNLRDKTFEQINDFSPEIGLIDSNESFKYFPRFDVCVYIECLSSV